jgi:hypothetical protein
MKKIILLLMVAALFACNNDGGTESTADSTGIDQSNTQDNTTNSDTGMMNDTMMNRRDTANRNQ